MAKAPKLFFRVTGGDPRAEYPQLHIEVWDDRAYNADWTIPDGALIMRYQCSKGDPGAGWYGFHLQVDARTGNDLEAAHRLYRRVKGKLEWFKPTPEELIERLIGLRAELVFFGQDSYFHPVEGPLASIVKALVVPA
jgi:hypothetical protein